MGIKLLPITEQNLAQKGLAQAKILLRPFFGGGYSFDSPCVYLDLETRRCFRLRGDSRPHSAAYAKALGLGSVSLCISRSPS